MARKWWTLIAVCTGVFMLLLDITVVNVALPQIQRAFHASLSDLQWTIDAYALTLAAFLLTAGSLADRFGRRRLFAIGLAIFTGGSLACGLAGGIVFLVLARAGQGIGGAIMFATSLALIAQTFSGRDRAVAFGVFGAITGVAVAIGPVLGGVITTGISWRWIFFVNIPVGLAALLVTLSRVRRIAQSVRRATRSGRISHLLGQPRWTDLRAHPQRARRLGIDRGRPLALGRGACSCLPSSWSRSSHASRCSISDSCASPPSTADSSPHSP